MNPQAVQLYRTLIRTRLGEQACANCGRTLEDAALVWVSDGSTLDDHGLTDESTAQLLAATERLLVRCSRCGTPREIGAPAPAAAQPAEPVATGREPAWDAHAVELYQSLIRARLKEHACKACRAPLESATVTWVAGGTALEDYAFGDESEVRLLASTQGLSVRCPQCGADTVV